MNGKKFAAPVNGAGYHVTDRFYARLRELVRDKVIPYQWEALNDRVKDAEPSGCIHNMKAAAEKNGEKHYGCVFQDSDLYKWMEAAAFTLMWTKDEKLEQEMEDTVSLLAAAQQPDGYLDTYYILGDMDRRWTNLKDHHELYCAGHMIEAAVAHFRATGRTTFLDVAEKLAAHIGSVLGPEEGKLHGYPGHEEIELALCKLYEVTGKEQYLQLARYFLSERGKQPLYFEEETKREGNGFYWKDSLMKYAYYQAHKPLLEQDEPIGHAVRANYLYAGAAAAARCAGDEELYGHLRHIWREMTEKQMYITGQVGSSEYGEAFTFPYDLPNDTAYAETCAGLALAFFANQMLKIERRGEYADVMERVLYNGAISGMDLTGTAFFYVNPLEVLPEACRRDQRKVHVQPVRQKWFGCACCPPNLARTLASITDYAVNHTDSELFQHLYLAGEYDCSLNGVDVHIALNGSYPWDGELSIALSPERPAEFTYALRIPGWCEGAYHIKVNGEAVSVQPENGYARLTRVWQPGDVVELSLPMEAKRVWANQNVREDAGRVAVQRGPMVFCLEEADNGKDLHRILLPRDSKFTEEFRPELLGGVMTLRCTAKVETGETSALYTSRPPETAEEKELLWVPYYAWANRGEGEMTVWVRDGR
ncbi:glycoside hydrolase family 127 protein [uncultured Neglectibacter sp.]|uniref:glycoside hydrolase family 127 protein n=1 Tax=uncultured Neglectibacter sp. TaxID=1924108 RepID=UPI0034DF929E